MEEQFPFAGPNGLIRKHELVRVIIQCLYTLSYARSASSLESESGIRCKSADFELLESQVMSGSWEECIRTLDSMDDLVGVVRIVALFLMFKQYLWEFLSKGEDGFALAVLREKVSKLGVDRGRI